MGLYLLACKEIKKKNNLQKNVLGKAAACF